LQSLVCQSWGVSGSSGRGNPSRARGSGAEGRASERWRTSPKHARLAGFPIYGGEGATKSRPSKAGRDWRFLGIGARMLCPAGSALSSPHDGSGGARWRRCSRIMFLGSPRLAAATSPACRPSSLFDGRPGPRPEAAGDGETHAARPGQALGRSLCGAVAQSCPC